MVEDLNESCQQLTDILNKPDNKHVQTRLGSHLSQFGVNIRDESGELRNCRDICADLRDVWDRLSQAEKEFLSTSIFQEHICTSLALVLSAYRCAKKDGKLSSCNAEAIDALERFCWYLDNQGVGIANEMWDYLDNAEENAGREWIRSVIAEHVKDDGQLIDFICSRRKRIPLTNKPLVEPVGHEKEPSDEFEEDDFYEEE